MIRRTAAFIALGVLATLASAGSAAAAPAWLAPTDLSAPGRDAVEPQVAVDAGGDTVAVWARSNGSDLIIQASSRPAAVAKSASPGALYPVVASLSGAENPPIRPAKTLLKEPTRENASQSSIGRWCTMRNCTGMDEKTIGMS